MDHDESRRSQNNYQDSSRRDQSEVSSPGIFGRQASPLAIAQRVAIDSSTLTPADVIQLQKTLGNEVVGRLLETSTAQAETLNKENSEEKEIKKEPQRSFLAVSVRQMQRANNEERMKLSVGENNQNTPIHQEVFQLLNDVGDVPIIQMKLRLDWDYKLPPKLIKDNDCFDFHDDLKKAMAVKQGEARCHTIGYDIICRGVADPINAFIKTNCPVYIDYLQGLINAIFPNGSGTQKFGFKELAKKYYNNAQYVFNKIEDLLPSICDSLSSKKNRENLDNLLYKLVVYANQLVNALNNSPDNLRPGNGITNSSIQEALDLIPDKVDTLLPGTKVSGAKNEVLKTPLQVYRISDLQNRQVEILLNETYSESGQIWAYSSGRQLQSSNYPNMISANMTQSNSIYIAIAMRSGEYFIFDIQ